MEPSSPKSFQERELINDEVKKMLESDIITVSNSRWSAPVVLITKPDKTVKILNNAIWFEKCSSRMGKMHAASLRRFAVRTDLRRRYMFFQMILIRMYNIYNKYSTG